MEISVQGLRLLQELEGSRAMPYKDVAGLLTIGVGHLLTKSELSSGKVVLNGQFTRYAPGLTSAQIDTLLKQDLLPSNSALESLALPVPLGQHQFDALTCLVFNIGVTAFLNSTLCRCLRAGDQAAVPVQWRRWVYVGGKVVLGLQVRRERELALYLATDAPGQA